MLNHAVQPQLRRDMIKLETFSLKDQTPITNSFHYTDFHLSRPTTNDKHFEHYFNGVFPNSIRPKEILIP